MFWTESHKSESFKSSRFLQKKYKRNVGKENPDKKENSMKMLCPHMKERTRSFWHNLEVNDASVDLIDEREECEDY